MILSHFENNSFLSKSGGTEFTNSIEEYAENARPLLWM